MGRWEGGEVGRWEGGKVRWRVGRWEGGKVGRWEGGRVGKWEVNGRATVTGKFDSIDSIVDPIRCWCLRSVGHVIVVPRKLQEKVFVARSHEMLVLWSETSFDRLWCNLESGL